MLVITNLIVIVPKQFLSKKSSEGILVTHIMQSASSVLTGDTVVLEINTSAFYFDQTLKRGVIITPLDNGLLRQKRAEES